MTTLQAVVFDLDDTLYPEHDYVRSGFRAVSVWAERRLGIPAKLGFAELVQLYRNGVRGDTFDRWLTAHGVHSGETIHQLVSVYRNHRPTIAPFPEAPGILAALGKRYRLGLLGDGYLKTQTQKLTALGLAHHFDALVFSDQWGRQAWKPSVKPFVVILEELRLPADSVVYVGDNPRKDFLGPHRLGMPSIWLRWAGGLYTGLEPQTDDHAPDAAIVCLDQLEPALAQLEARF